MKRAAEQAAPPTRGAQATRQQVTQSIRLRNSSGNFHEYSITEDRFRQLSVEEMVRFIIHNNQNNGDFIEHFYRELERRRPTTFGSIRNPRQTI